MVCLLLAPSAAQAVDQAKSATPRAPADANTCSSCHLTLSELRLRSVAEQYQQSVHRDERIGCVGCHGGTPTDPTVRAHDPETGFVARPPREAISGVCGDCHADPVFVRRFSPRLPVDQKKLFELSLHGKLASAADPNAPTCADCHGTHDVLSPQAPDAPVNQSRVVELCARCHADPERMKSYGTSVDQLKSWKASRHGVAFLAGNQQAPNCTGCHSPHAGTLETYSAAALCGRCHEEQRRLFLASPHAKPFRKLGLAECLPCHGDHDVSESGWLMGMSPEAACSRCHRKGDRGANVATGIAKLLRGLDERAHRVKQHKARAELAGIHAPDAALALAKVESGRIELAAQIHDLDLDRLSGAHERLDAVTAQAESAIKKSERARALEVKGYYLAIFVCSLLFVLLVLEAVRLARRRSGRSE